MKIDEAIIFLSDNEFTFAKSYEKSYPHYYLQKSKCSNKNKYEDFIKLIRENGKVYHFNNKQYIYLQIDEFIYWEMGRPIKCVEVINKADSKSLLKNNQYLANDEISNLLKSKLQEREIYLNNLLKKEIKTEKDKKQIEFLMNTERRIHGGGKNIIDNYKIEIIYE